ncbi:MAG TPA: hypothetical protein P5511_01345, partial [Candidatus Goldiibacteriota bacterium]|nr:hypothetical protein [Candidatus Goldiibacteriota bacterium]
PFFLPSAPFASVPASVTRTVYIRAKISQDAAVPSFKLSAAFPDSILAENNPSGYVTVSAAAGYAFPFETGLAAIIESVNVVKVGREDLMPVSAVKGQAALPVMNLNFRNESGIDMYVTGVTLTVKSVSGSELNASSVISGLRLAGQGGEVFGHVTPQASAQVYIETSGLQLRHFSDTSIRVEADIAASASRGFYVELVNAADISADQPASIQAASGTNFGFIRSGAVSIQQPFLAESFHSFPNPFNPDRGQARIEYYLQNPAEVTISIFTLDGKPVRKIADKAQKTSGLKFEDIWDGKKDSGGSVISGVYLCVIEVKDNVTGETRKLSRKIAVLR